MKNLSFIIAVVLFLSLSSCEYLKEHLKRSDDTVLDMTVTEPEPIVEDTTTFTFEEPEPEPVITEPVVTEPEFGYGSSRYYMIVGSFQNQNFAVNYADKIHDMGYQTRVILATNGFYRVSAKTYESFQQGVNDITNFRNTVASQAWLHVKN